MDNKFMSIVDLLEYVKKVNKKSEKLPWSKESDKECSSISVIFGVSELSLYSWSRGDENFWCHQVFSGERGGPCGDGIEECSQYFDMGENDAMLCVMIEWAHIHHAKVVDMRESWLAYLRMIVNGLHGSLDNPDWAKDD